MEEIDETFAFTHLENLSKQKREIENNKLDNRKDVQILRKKIAILNNELIWAKKKTKEAKAVYQDLSKHEEDLSKQHKRLCEHLTLISNEHNTARTKKIKNLIRMMQVVKYPAPCKMLELEQDDKQDHAEEPNEDSSDYNQTDTNKVPHELRESGDQ